MLFHTPIFGMFLVVTLLVAASLRHAPSARKIFLLAASYGFYMAWDARYLLLILFSTAVDYAVGAALRQLAWRPGVSAKLYAQIDRGSGLHVTPR